MKLIKRIYNLMGNNAYRYVIFFLLFAVSVICPYFLNDYILNVLWNAMFYMALALGINIIVGYCGLCDLGYAAKVAIGAYTTGILTKNFGWNFWPTIPVAILVSAIIAVIIGWPTLKLRSDYFAIVTLGLAEILRIVVRNISITGSARGINGIIGPSIFGMRLTQINQWYYLFLLLVALFIFLSNRIRYSRFGRALTYIREDEAIAQAMGVNTNLYKLNAYIIGTVFGSIIGSFYAAKMTSISPSSFDFNLSVNILLIVILGGMGKIPGIILGALFFAVLPELMRDPPVLGDMRMLFFGLLLIVMMIKRPQGLWPESAWRK